MMVKSTRMVPLTTSNLFQPTEDILMTIGIPSNLENFADKGKYSSHDFAWNMSAGA